MKLCPNCNQAARASSSYPGTYVCNCLGVLEDINLIKPAKVISAQVKSELIYGQVFYAPNKKEILGSIVCTKGYIYHFDRDLYPFSLGEFVCFKPITWYADGSYFAVQGATELKQVPQID